MYFEMHGYTCTLNSPYIRIQPWTTAYFLLVDPEGSDNTSTTDRQALGKRRCKVSSLVDELCLVESAEAQHLDALRIGHAQRVCYVVSSL